MLNEYLEGSSSSGEAPKINSSSVGSEEIGTSLILSKR